MLLEVKLVFSEVIKVTEKQKELKIHGYRLWQSYRKLVITTYTWKMCQGLRM